MPWRSTAAKYETRRRLPLHDKHKKQTRERKAKREQLVRQMVPDQWVLARRMKQSERRALTFHGLAMESLQPADFGRARMIMLTPKGEQLREALLAADARNE